MEKRLSNRKMIKKWVVVPATLMVATSILAACTGGAQSTAEKHVLRIGVLYGGADNEPYFRSQYTDTYEMMNPEVDFEIVSAIDYSDMRFQTPDENGNIDQPDPYAKMKEMLTGDNPVDVVVLDYSMLRRLVQDNLLKQLDPLISQSKFDLTDYVPTVIDGIKSAGDNNIYALTPTFSSSALFYNKKLFEENGVEPPTDNMTWKDVMDKARLMSKGEGADRKYGMTFSRWNGGDFNSDVQTYSSALQLKMWDDKGEKMLVNTPQWETVWNTIAGLYREDIVPDQDDINKINEESNKASEDGNYVYNPTQGDLFASGKVAMTIADYYYVNELNSTMNNASKIKGFEAFDWDVVTYPTHEEAPGIGGNISFSQLMGINNNAQNPEDAWKFIQFTNSKEWAEMKSRSTYELVARKEFLKPKNGMNYNIDAFTSLKPIPPQSVDTEQLFRDKPGIWEAQNASYELFQKVIKGDITSKEALAEWETKGNSILEKLKKQPAKTDSSNAADGGSTDDASTQVEEEETTATEVPAG
ncbi:extracellular solute-binding protein [Paenibacillus sp. KS-LC4]|uniref:ABC transporter substrate-binding protein n=1 Tax=Paenibacillus sp. KS-LC4 TaxID=2979727 RepID=UPI0030D2F818